MHRDHAPVGGDDQSTSQMTRPAVRQAVTHSTIRCVHSSTGRPVMGDAWNHLQQPPRLARPKHPQHHDIAGCLIAPGVREHPVEHSIGTSARQFLHCVMAPYRVATWMIAQRLNRGPDCFKPPLRSRNRSWLRQPASCGLEIGQRPIGITHIPRHDAAGSAAGIRNGKLVICPDAVDPGLHPR